MHATQSVQTPNTVLGHQVYHVSCRELVRTILALLATPQARKFTTLSEGDEISAFLPSTPNHRILTSTRQRPIEVAHHVARNGREVELPVRK